MTRYALHAVILFLLLFLLVLYDVSNGWAQEFTPDDTLQAIEDASLNTGISASWLRRVVGCETGYTWNPYSVGRAGELGPAQLHPRGELRRFYALGYDNPYDPYQALDFMAHRFAAGGARAWSCR